MPTLYTLRLKVKANVYPWLNKAATEVNQVWNWANEVSLSAADRNKRAAPKWLSGIDLINLSAGAAEYFDHIGADTIQKVCGEFATKRKQFKKVKLRWRTSFGSRRSLGWVPFKAASLRRDKESPYVRFCGKSIRVYEAQRLAEISWGDSCFAQDAVGDWYLCLSVKWDHFFNVAPEPKHQSVGIDLGLKEIAVCSSGERLPAGHWTRRAEAKLAQAQRRGHKKQAKRIHRKAARQREYAMHKFTRRMVNKYGSVFVGDVSSSRLARTRMAKSVYDASWSTLRTQLSYKGKLARRSVKIIDERNTTRDCSVCGATTGPSGYEGLVVREWKCEVCGSTHCRDANSGRNLEQRGGTTLGLRCVTGASPHSAHDMSKEPPLAGTNP